ncbi:MAG: helix-turn-helix transcriptional regulator, partial [Terrimicrobiaceae bacterium]
TLPFDPARPSTKSSRHSEFNKFSRSGKFISKPANPELLFPIGIKLVAILHFSAHVGGTMTAQYLGKMIRERRKHLGMKQAELALVSNTGLRFISELENGKETCQLGRTLKVLEHLGLKTVIEPREK